MLLRLRSHAYYEMRNISGYFKDLCAILRGTRLWLTWFSDKRMTDVNGF